MCASENFQSSNDCTVTSCTLLINANAPSDNILNLDKILNLSLEISDENL